MKDINISTKKEENRITICFEGSLNNDNVSECEKIIFSEINGIENVIFDMDGLSYISTMGLRLILSVQNAIDDIDDGTLRLINLKGEVVNILEVAGFTKFLDKE